jgi:uncharacterized protein (TIGR02246 family)
MTQTTLAAPGDVVGAFADAWNRRDPDALAALFDEDAEFVNVTGLWWHDRPSIRKAHAYGLERIFNTSTLFATEVRVKRLSDAVAVVHARLKLAGQTPVPTDKSVLVTAIDVVPADRYAARQRLHLTASSNVGTMTTWNAVSSALAN